MINEKPLVDYRVTLSDGRDTMVYAGSYQVSGGRLRFFDEYGRFLFEYGPDEWTDVDED